MSVTRNPNLGPSHIRAKKRRLFFVRFYIVLFFLLVVVFGLAILSGHEKIIIKNIIISGNATVENDEILTIVNRDLAGRYWQLFSKSNFLIFPRFAIKADILKEIKIVNDVNVSWDGWQQISIVISERKPTSVWCGNDSQNNEADCFFVDKNGYIYTPASTFSGNLFIRDYSNISTTTDPVGQYYLPTEVYSQLFKAIDLLAQKDLKVIAVSFDGFDYKFILDSGPEIIFNGSNSFNLSFTNLFSALETKNLDLVKEAAAINYVDLRFENKVVVGKKGVSTTSKLIKP